jgi:hypothetical protein
MPYGVFRRVVFLGPFAIKLPRWSMFLRAMRCNRWEREMWIVWRPMFQWDNLCPIILADPLGLFVLMRKATQPVTEVEFEEAESKFYPNITNEGKLDDYGYLDLKVVALDYGLHDESHVREKRRYYGEMIARRTS